MVDERAGTLADRFRDHVRDAQHLYGYAIRAMADDWEAGGPVRDICTGYEDAPGDDMIQLRLLAGVFRLVLTGRAEALRPFYNCLGGTATPDQVWPVLRSVLADQVDELREALVVAPQTNEIGRSAALLAGLFALVERTGEQRIRLLELGASGGLNLLADQVHVSGPDWSAGPVDSPVQLVGAIEGPVRPRPFTVVERRGCDPHPVDPTSAAGRLLLTSFVWPFDVHRHQRLAAALELADRRGRAPVDAATAAPWLVDQLGTESDGLTVVWHSITRQYWSAEERQQVDELLTSRSEVAVVGMEFGPDAQVGGMPWLTISYAGGSGRLTEQLGTAHHHGIPVRLTSPTGNGPR